MCFNYSKSPNFRSTGAGYFPAFVLYKHPNTLNGNPFILPGSPPERCRTALPASKPAPEKGELTGPKPEGLRKKGAITGHEPELP